MEWKLTRLEVLGIDMIEKFDFPILGCGSQIGRTLGDKLIGVILVTIEL